MPSWTFMKIGSLIYSYFGTWTHRAIHCNSFYPWHTLIQIQICLLEFFNVMYYLFHCFQCWHLKLLLAWWLVTKCLRNLHEVCSTYCIAFFLLLLPQLVMMAMTDLLKRIFLLANVRTRKIQRKTEVTQLWKVRALLKRTQKWS